MTELIRPFEILGSLSLDDAISKRVADLPRITALGLAQLVERFVKAHTAHRLQDSHALWDQITLVGLAVAFGGGLSALSLLETAAAAEQSPGVDVQHVLYQAWADIHNRILNTN